MCRFVAYLGEKTVLDDVVVKPTNSIIRQSLHARESHSPTNGDGFGLGWYAKEISDTPALFTSILPAWNDKNLLNLTRVIQSGCFFAHVRAASFGGVSQSNCHPFVYQQWMLMHNGEIYKFSLIKRHLRHLLENEIYDWIKGQTDSEHFFALFLQLGKNKDLNDPQQAIKTLKKTIKTIDTLLKRFGEEGPCFYNLCLTNGRYLIATRYCSDPNLVPESLHYALATELSLKHGRYHLPINSETLATSSVVSSEKLTNIARDWQTVPVNHLLLIDETLNIHLSPL